MAPARRVCRLICQDDTNRAPFAGHAAETLHHVEELDMSPGAGGEARDGEACRPVTWAPARHVEPPFGQIGQDSVDKRRKGHRTKVEHWR